MNWKHVLRENFFKLLFVFAALLLMVAVSYFSVNSIMREQIIESAKRELVFAESNIKVSLHESEINISIAALSIKRIIENGGSQDEVERYLNEMTYWILAAPERWLVYRALYGVFRGEFIDGTGWKPPGDYIFFTKPWFIAARDAKGSIGKTLPYRDTRSSNAANTSGMIISLAQEIYGVGRKYLGVVAIDMYLEQLFQNVASHSLVEGGYGIILNENLNIIAHKDVDLINKPIADCSKGYGRIAQLLAAGQDLSGEVIEEDGGVEWIVFFKKMYNGWFVGTLAPVNNFYAPAQTVSIRLSALAAFLFIILSAILLSLSVSKMISDEENRNKTNFLARMSHEIRTPMNAIIGMSELALRSEDHRSIMDYVMGIKQSGQNLLSVINDVLDVVKIESGKVDIAHEPYRVQVLLNDVINGVKVWLQGRPILFTVNAGSNIPDMLMGDETCIRQVLTNLLSNAVKYTHSGCISLSVEGMEIGEHNILLRFEVSDTGIGIKEDDFERLFGSFVRLDAEANKYIEGTGLGLSISRSLILAMGGEINVSSIYGKGSTFIAAIPQIMVADAGKLACVGNSANKRVILYSDKPAYGISVMLALHSLEVPITVTSDPKKFIEKFSSGIYEFAFVTFSMLEDAVSLQKLSKLKTRIVLLAKIGELSPFKDVIAAEMPVYVSGIVDILNGHEYEGKIAVPATRYIFPSSKVLVVDDNLTNLKVTHGLLDSYKMRVDLCDSGVEALRRAAETEYDLIFMDHMMPVMDGIETTLRLREMGGYSNTPIIALTANAVSGMREIFLRNGMSDFLSKPIDSARLEAILREWLPNAEREVTKEADENSSFLSVHEIRETNLERALKNLGGNKQLLFNVIRTYIKHTSLMLDKIKSPSAETLGEYAIIVHGIKGSSASLAADEIAARAYELERASKAGDLSSVITKNDDFIRITRELISSLTAFLLEEAGESDKEIRLSPDEKCLRKIIEACEKFDASAIEENLSELEQYIYEYDTDLVKWIREQYENIEYDAINERLSAKLNDGGRKSNGVS